MWQSKVVLVSALGGGIILSFPLILLFGIFIGVPVAGLLAVLLERLLHRIFKDAHKAKTVRMKRYIELKAFRERNAMQSSSSQQMANRVPVTDCESQPRVPHHRAYGSVHGGSDQTRDKPA